MPAEQTIGVFQDPGDLVELGRVISAYGVKGWIKIQSHSAQADALLQVRTWWIKAPVSTSKGTGASARAAQVLAARKHGATVLAQIDLAPNRDVAESLKASTVWVPRSQFPAAAEDEYYWVDLIGCRLFGESDGTSDASVSSATGPMVLIGVVQEVIDNGAHAVLRVARATLDPDGQAVLLRNAKGHTLDVLVPFVAAHVHTVDLADKRLESNWPLEF